MHKKKTRNQRNLTSAELVQIIWVKKLAFLNYFFITEIAILLREFTRVSCPVFYSFLEAPKFYWRDSSKYMHYSHLFMCVHKDVYINFSQVSLHARLFQEKRWCAYLKTHDSLLSWDHILRQIFSSPHSNDPFYHFQC